MFYRQPVHLLLEQVARYIEIQFAGCLPSEGETPPRQRLSVHLLLSFSITYYHQLLPIQVLEICIRSSISTC